MDKTVPKGAALLLDFIGGIEAPKGYDTIYGNNQGKLAKPVTAMTLAEILAAQPGWTNRFGSSAAGRYQFMKATLEGLLADPKLGLSGAQRLDADLQDRLGYQLLKRRGYEAFMAGTLSRTEFGRRLAQEWASLPVLTATAGQKRKVERGQSYYAGDGLNKALVAPQRVEAVLDQVKAAGNAAVAPGTPPAEPVPIPVIIPVPTPAQPVPADQSGILARFWAGLKSAFGG